MEQRADSWNSFDQQSCSRFGSQQMRTEFVNENARMSFFEEDEDEDEQMDIDSAYPDSQLLEEDSGLGSTASRGKTASLTSMFSQFKTSPSKPPIEFGSILEVSAENLAMDLSDHEKETISNLNLLEKKVEGRSPGNRKFCLKDVTNTTPRKNSPTKRVRRIDRKRSCAFFKNVPSASSGVTQNRKRRGDFLLEKRTSPKGIPSSARPIRRIQSTSILETSGNSDCLSPESVEIEDTAFHSISGHTLSVLLDTLTQEEFDEKFILIDCRYPFEYNGGHVKNARNVYQPELIKSIFFPNSPIKFREINTKIPIFYCEFSQKRGPKMARELRRCDRRENESRYPHLDYPEIYLLDHGYRRFFETASFHQLCEPQHYIPMLHPTYTSQLSQYNQHKKRGNHGMAR